MLADAAVTRGLLGFLAVASAVRLVYLAVAVVVRVVAALRDRSHLTGAAAVRAGGAALGAAFAEADP